MGVLIVLLAAVLVGELLRRAFFSEPEGPRSALPQLRAVDAGLPPGARIAELAATQNYVVIHAVMPDGETRLYVLDPQAGSLETAGPQIVPPEEADAPLAR
jgi:hypothetical protein